MTMSVLGGEADVAVPRHLMSVQCPLPRVKTDLPTANAEVQEKQAG
jgi:hypothetical protein